MKLNKKSGFTLLEIIIVIIIIGVLASLALPKFFQTINFAKSTEALNTLGEIRRAADRCAMLAGGSSADYSTCNTFAALGMDVPDSAFWNYVIVTTNTGGLQIRANFMGTGSINFINFGITSTGASKSGTGIFTGIK